MAHEFAIITPYHFGPESIVEYERLKKSISASLREIKNRGILILVANGTGQRAGDPRELIDALGVSSRAIRVVKLQDNAGSVGALNAGVEEALAEGNDAEWIGKVDSSAILYHEWGDAIARGVGDEFDAIYGQQRFDDDPDTIYSDGHTLEKGLTKDVNFSRKLRDFQPNPPSAFPCLGVALYRTRLVRRIVEMYGNFACENLPHYGMCTDVALRALAANQDFKSHHCASAIAAKRRPAKNYRDIAIWQLLSAKLYYTDKVLEAEHRLRGHSSKRYEEIVVDSKREALRRARQSYSPTGVGPPRVTAEVDAGLEANWLDGAE